MKLSKHNGISAAYICVCLMLGLTAGAGAQSRDAERVTKSQSSSTKKASSTTLSDWRYDRVYDGWYADAVVDREVYGPHGNEIGNVKNLLLNERGEVVALIAEIGGLLDIADTHVTIPWDEVERRDGKVFSPITDETAEQYGMFADEYFTADDIGSLGAVDEFFETGPHVWKATALLDDYAVLETGEPFGYVTDLVFDDGGKLISVVAVESRGDIRERGVYAFPWDDRRWRPGLDRYTLRYTAEDIARLPKIDYSEFDTRP